MRIESRSQQSLTRRKALIVLFGVGAAGVVAACAPSPPPAPATAPTAAPTTAPAQKPAPQPTAPPPAATQAPAPKPQPTGSPLGAQAPAAKKPPVSVGVRLGWRLIGYFAAFQASVDKGFWADQGLDVKIFEGAGSVPVMQLIASGEQALGFFDAAVMAQGVQKGIDCRMVACMYQRNMYGILSPADAPLKQPSDLIGKKIAGFPGAVAEVMWPAFGKKVGIDVNQVTMVNTDPAGKYAVLLARKVDGSFHQVPADAVTYEDQNFPVARLPYSDFGLDALGLGIVAMNKTIKESPDMIRGFLAGLAKGWAYAAEHPPETVAMAKKAFESTMTEPTLLKQWNAYREFERTPRTKDKPLFWTDKQDWESTQSALRESGFLTETRPVETYFTNEFLPAS